MLTHEEMIRQAYDALMQALPAEMDADHRALIEDAYALAAEAHSKQTRKSGLPYILHPLAVALVVVKEMRQDDPDLISAALLHDVVEDTPYTIEDIEARFGADVAFLVGAVTKPNKQQIDNFQHILKSVKGDIRVLILKLSDRLHNMRTLDGLRTQKQWKIASETQFFFAPLAGRLGLYKIKSELENLAFKFLNPSEFAFIERNLEEDRLRTLDAVESFMRDAEIVVSAVFSNTIRWDIRYRKPYSIWREMQELDCDFYHVPFKHFVRAVFKLEEVERYTKWIALTEEDVVMKIYGILSEAYSEQTGSFVNYMAQPKANGYRSVHVKLLNPYGGIEEFHISSESMREQSYFGCILDEKEQWLRRLTEVLNELAEDPDSMMPGIRDSLYNEDIVAFTPKSKPITLPKGATALDFAYGLHTDLGDHAQYARINGRLCSIKTVLHRGDCVEIGTNPNAHPKEDWLKYVVSFKASKHIRNYLKRQPHPRYQLCPHCHPMPGSEIIGFTDAGGHTIVHTRNCPEAIRTASEKGNAIIAVDDFTPDPSILYPVSIHARGIDRYHIMRDIIDCIAEDHHLSMSSVSCHTADDIFHCDIDFAVHSSDELAATISSIAAIDGVEEVKQVKTR